MDDPNVNSRISRISTIWALLEGAHRRPSADVRDARLALVQRYQGAAYRYLLGAVRDIDAADELFQEFALRVLRGTFCRAAPERGRFRDYLKISLFHLVVDYQRQQAKQPLPLDSSMVQPEAPDGSVKEADQQFLCSWRDELLARAWSSLAEAERQGGQPYYSLLKFRAEAPGTSSAEMAARLSEQLHLSKPYTETAVRKALQRARTQFADFLIDDVAHSLGSHTFEELEQELIDLGLLSYCRSALNRRRAE